MDHRPKTLFRLLPTCSPPSTIQFGQWIRITVEALGEFGTYQREVEPGRVFKLRDGQTIMPLECFLLVESKGQITRVSTSNQHLRLERRALQSPNWDGLDNLSGPGVGPSGRGGLEVRVVRTMTGAPATLWINIGSETDRDIVPLVLGPIRLSTKAFDLNTATMEVLRPFNIPAVRGIHPRIMLLKEVWNNVPQGRVWDSAFVLKEIFRSEVMAGIDKSAPPLFAGKKTLDLSAGTGLLGLFIAGLAQMELEGSPPPIPTATKVVLTDLEHALDLIKHNIHSNKPKIAPNIELTAKALAWGASHLVRFRGVTFDTFDTVVASDVVYEAANFDHLLETLFGLCTPGRTMLYLGYKRRALTKDSEDLFFNKISRKFKSQHSLHGLDVHVWRLWRE